MSDNIRVGLIGYGYASKTFHAPLIAGTPGLELAVISSSDETKVKADWPTVTVVSEPKHLFNDPNIDLIVIPTPNDTHFPLAKAALEAGKHVVVDKPFTVTLSQARELDALAKSLGRVLSVFHNRRWDSDFLTLKGLLAEGVLGEVAYFESHFDRFRPQVRDRWREQGGPGSGIWYDLAPHLLDQAITLFGLPVSMTVDLAQLRPGAQSTDYFHAILSYPQRRVILHGTMLAAAESARYILHGSRGSYVKYGLDPQEERLKNGEEMFIILDEILKGTNSMDKQKGSFSLVKQLLQLKTNGIIATHDLLLGELKKHFPNEISNYCFEADIQNDELTFSYKLREGVAQNMNACFLMQKMGINIE